MAQETPCIVFFVKPWRLTYLLAISFDHETHGPPVRDWHRNFPDKGFLR